MTFRYRRDGKWAFIPLGSFPTLTLADAREKAKGKCEQVSHEQKMKILVI
ncbi:Arm DNA-binding domain-containing protein [Aeromonas caviae]